MCGIIGVANFGKKSIPALSKYMQQGAIVGVLRGSDSTGMFSMDGEYKYSIAKLPYSGEIFAESKLFKSAMYDMNSTGYTVLHHRAATRGSVSLENAHPFLHEDDDNRLIIGVHNGTLHGSVFRRDGIDFEVDSDYLFYKMMKDGADKALSTTGGAIASVWTERDAHLRLFANYGRPLHFGIVKDENAILIASEAEMLYWLARRNDIVLEDLVEVDKNLIHTFRMGGDVRDFDTQAVEVPADHSNFPGRWGGTAGTTKSGTGRTGDTSGTSKKGSVSLATYGLKVRDELVFYPEDSIDVSSTVVRGYVEAGTDIVPAVMYNVSPAMMNALDNRMAEATVEALAIATSYDNESKETDHSIVVSVPSKITYGDMSPFASMEDDTDDSSVERPGRHLTVSEYYDMTGGECVNCQTPVPHDTVNKAWVNDDKNVVCGACALDLAGGM